MKLFFFSFLQFATINEVSGRGLDPPLRQASFEETGIEIIYIAILALLLILVGQLSATGLKRTVNKHNVP